MKNSFETFQVLCNQGGQMETFLFDGNATPLNIGLLAGSIRVVPEPSMGTFALVGLVGILLRRRAA